MRQIRKKGVVSEGIVMIQSIFILLLIMMLAFFIFKISFKTSKEVIDSTKLGDKNIALLNILRTEYNGKELSDILVESYKKGDYEEFRSGLKPVLDKLYEKEALQGFIIAKLMPKNANVFEPSAFLQVYHTGKKFPSAKIPIDKENYLEVTLYD